MAIVETSRVIGRVVVDKQRGRSPTASVRIGHTRYKVQGRNTRFVCDRVDHSDNTRVGWLCSEDTGPSCGRFGGTGNTWKRVGLGDTRYVCGLICHNQNT